MKLIKLISLVLPHQISENEENGKALFEDRNEDDKKEPHLEAVDNQESDKLNLERKENRKVMILNVDDELVISRV